MVSLARDMTQYNLDYYNWCNSHWHNLAQSWERVKMFFKCSTIFTLLDFMSTCAECHRVPPRCPKLARAMQGPVSQRVAINRTMDINRSSMANCVKLAINSNPSETGPRVIINSAQLSYHELLLKINSPKLTTTHNL